jgi:poly(3-hydroxybutyrate) depolymerase
MAKRMLPVTRSRGWFFFLCFGLGPVGCGATCGSSHVDTRSMDAGPDVAQSGTGGSGTSGATGTGGATGSGGAPGACSFATAPGSNSGFAAGGQSRSFYLALPPASFSGPRPLLFVWHGTGCTGQAVVTGTSGGCGYNLATDFAARGWIVVAPDSNRNGAPWPVWDAIDPPTVPAPPHVNADDALFDELTNCLRARHAVDADRIFVAGHSAGGAMTNHTLGRRSDLLAGGIVAGSLFDFTQPRPPLPLSPMAVLTTWGGPNDSYTGAAGGVTVSGDNAEESGLTSQYWEAAPGGHGVRCSGNPPGMGHTWLHTLNPWARAWLEAHPRGMANLPNDTLAPAPAGITCSESAYVHPPPVTVTCDPVATAGCQAYCQLQADCIVENGTLGRSMAPQLMALGWSGTSCTSCESTCASDAMTGAEDAAVLSCLARTAPTTQCGPGLVGGNAALTVDACCANHRSAAICTRFCNTFRTSFWYGMFGACRT